MPWMPSISSCYRALRENGARLHRAYWRAWWAARAPACRAASSGWKGRGSSLGYSVRLAPEHEPGRGAGPRHDQGGAQGGASGGGGAARHRAGPGAAFGERRGGLDRRGRDAPPWPRWIRSSTASAPSTASSARPHRSSCRPSSTGEGARGERRILKIRASRGWSGVTRGATAQVWFRHSPGTCRAAPGPEHRRAGRADLSDHELCVRGPSGGGGLLQPAGIREYLFEDHEPDRGGVRGTAGESRRRVRRGRLRERARGAGSRALHACSSPGTISFRRHRSTAER